MSAPLHFGTPKAIRMPFGLPDHHFHPPLPPLTASTDGQLAAGLHTSSSGIHIRRQDQRPAAAVSGGIGDGRSGVAGGSLIRVAPIIIGANGQDTKPSPMASKAGTFHPP